MYVCMYALITHISIYLGIKNKKPMKTNLCTAEPAMQYKYACREFFELNQNSFKSFSHILFYHQVYHTHTHIHANYLEKSN